MKNFICYMKTKVLFIVAFFAVAVSASAQFNWGVKAGFNASTIYGIKEDGDNSTKVNYRPGFHVGVMGQYMMSQNFGLETGLYYSTLGVNLKEEDHSEGDYYKSETKMSPSYLQLPISALYKIRIGENLSLNPSLGVYFGYGLGGKIKFTEEYSESTDIDEWDEDYFGKVEIYDGETTEKKEWFNRFDMGATVGLNLQFEKFLIGLGYDYGFMKVNKEKMDKNLYNGNIKVSVGYLF